jgi:hypothetical protein
MRLNDFVTAKQQPPVLMAKQQNPPLIVFPESGAQYNPQAIREVERILKLNLAVSR